jgi:prevent-host-death family protein
VTDAKNNLSALLDHVRTGAAVLIVDRGRPVARLEPVSGRGRDEEGPLARLVRSGVVRPARARLPKAVLTTPPPVSRPGASALGALLDERRAGR